MSVGSLLERIDPLARKSDSGYTIPVQRRMARRLGVTLSAALLLTATPALADRVALLPAVGPDDATRNAVLMEVTRGLVSMGHTVVPVEEIAAAVKSTTDGVVDTPDEKRAIGRATKADWVVVAKVEPAVTTEHVEIEADLVPLGRVESVAREVEKAQSEAQIREMLVVLLRPEGISAGEMPWEKAPPPPPKPAPVANIPVPLPIAPPPSLPPPETGPPSAVVDYPLGRATVWPPYSAGRGGFIGAELGFSVPASRPGNSAGSGGSLVGVARAGYAPGDAGLEIFGQLGGNLLGPRALWIEGGGRWMLTPGVRRGEDGVRRGTPFHIGPELTLGAFVRLAGPDEAGPGGVSYSGTSDAHFTLGAALDLALSLSPDLQLEGHLGNLRWVPTSDGAIVLLGATFGAAYRF